MYSIHLLVIHIWNGVYKLNFSTTRTVGILNDKVLSKEAQGEKAGEKMHASEYVQAKTSVYFLQTKCRERKPAMSHLKGTFLPRTTKAVPALRDSLQTSENRGLQRQH